MFGRTFALALSFLAVVSLCPRPAVGGQISTPLQTQSIPMTQTNWGPGMRGGGDPLTFGQFNPALGVLNAVDITLTTTIKNDFILSFFATPTPTKLYLATTETSDPSILADPSRVAQLTDGPTVTLRGPDGVTPIFGGAGTTLPVDVVSLSESSGTWSSMLAVTDPHFIPPDDATLSLSRSLDPTGDTSLVAGFIGTGTIGLPITAIAHSSFYSDSGNGSGAVLTSADATVTVQYWYTPAAVFTVPPVPEPSGLILLGLGAGSGLFAARRRRHARAACSDDRTRA